MTQGNQQIRRATRTHCKHKLSFLNGQRVSTENSGCWHPMVIPIDTTIKTNMPRSGPYVWLSGSRNKSIMNSQSGNSGSYNKRSVDRIKIPASQRQYPIAVDDLQTLGWKTSLK